MQKVENGLFVQVAYTGTLEDGQVFDTSEGRDPLEVPMGGGQMIPGFEAALMGMELGEKKTFTLTPDEAYGEHMADRIMDFPVAQIPEGMDPQVGQTIGVSTSEGQQMPALITYVDEEKLTLDLNHPLAGKSLTFGIEVVGISDQAAAGQEAACSTEGCSGCSGCEQG
ncbi:FKBP-type peptidyl-prolyl cis-trans isomerase [Desulfoplanes sp.]